MYRLEGRDATYTLRDRSRNASFVRHGLQISGEDYWPKWMQPYVRLRFPRTKFLVRDGLDLTWRQTRVALNDHSRQILEVACKRCNNQWMSNIQNKASAILKPHLRGEAQGLDLSNSEALSTWATMFVLVIEFSDIKTAAATQLERTEFMSTKRPLENWMVFALSRTGGTMAGINFRKISDTG